MRHLTRFIYGLVIVILLSSCGAIPTLPPLDSTVTIRTPYITILPAGITATHVRVEATVLPTTQPSKTIEPQKTSTFTQVPSSPTRTATVLPSGTPTQVPTKTATLKPTILPSGTPSQTPTKTATLTPTKTPTRTFTPTAFPYLMQPMNPFYLANFTHPEKGCSWLGVAGQIFNKDGQVQKQVVIKAGGTIKGKALVETTVIPLAEQAVDLAYGPGGFELTLANGVAATTNEAWIQLFNLAGNPVSDKVFLVTYDDCQKNLILMNFSQK